jgi:hypothetical protein
VERVGGDGAVPEVRIVRQNVNGGRSPEKRGLHLRGEAGEEHGPEHGNGKVENALASLLDVKKLPTFAWAMPCYGPISPKVYVSHMRALGNVAKMRMRIHPVNYMITNKCNLATASNRIVERALHLGVDYVFWTEMDMDLPADVIARLYDQKKDVCGGLYFLRGDKRNPEPCAYMKSRDPVHKFAFLPIGLFNKNRLYKVDALGMGCVLFKTEVFKKIKEPWFDDRQNECGQDMYFYKKLKEAGVDVFLDTGVQCGQYQDEERIGIEDWDAFVVREGSTPGGVILGAGADRFKGKLFAD